MEFLKDGINAIQIPFVDSIEPLRFKKDDEPLIEWEWARVGKHWLVRQRPPFTFRRERIVLDCFIRVDGKPYRCGYSHYANKWFASLLV